MTLSMNLFRASGKKAVLSDNKLTHSLRIEKQMVLKSWQPLNRDRLRQSNFYRREIRKGGRNGQAIN